MCTVEEGDYDVDCKCSQYGHDDGDDRHSIAMLLIAETDETLQASRIDRLNRFLSDVHSYGIYTKLRRALLYISLTLMTLLFIILLFIFFWKYYQNTNGIVAISLHGNGQVQIGRAGFPFHSWTCLFKHGAIDLVEGRKIAIKRSGLYHIYTQMLFFYNAVRLKRNFTVNPVMDFGVTQARTNKRLLATSVSIHSCRVACTRYVAGIVCLQTGDMLTLDTATPGVYFKMVKDKAFFGAYLISDE